jgi:hypothetical protein
MASQRQKQMNELYASIKEGLSKPNIDLAMRRNIAQGVHLAARESDDRRRRVSSAPAFW